MAGEREPGSHLRWHRGLWAGAISLAVVTGMVAVGPGVAAATESCETHWQSRGTGIADDPYLVETRSDLEMIAECPDRAFRQVADISLDSPLPTLGVFTGTYDGDSHSIDHLTTTPGLFSALSGSATVEKLTLSDVEITGDDSLGALAGSVTDTARISHVTASGQVGEPASFIVGGVVGYVQGPESNGPSAGEGPELSDVNWRGDVQGLIAVGGVAGAVQFGSLSGSSASGTITGRGESSYAIGGLLGYAINADVRDSSVADMVVEAAMIGGGLVGYSEESTLASLVSTSAVSSQLAAGGLAGALSASSMEDVVAHGTATSPYAAGGVAGAVVDSSVKRASTDAIVSGDAFVGGAVGLYLEGTELDDVSATGAVTGDRFVGGLAGGSQNSPASISNSWASGAVTARAFAGGLMGQLTGVLSRSHATGPVTVGEDSAGGLVGITLPIGYSCSLGDAQSCSTAQPSVTTIDQSYATGAVHANTNAGGLVGRIPEASCLSYPDDCVPDFEDATTVVTDSYATGNVTASRGAGGLIGSTAYVPFFELQPTSATLSAVADLPLPVSSRLVPDVASAHVPDTSALTTAWPVGVANSYSSGATSASSNRGGLVGESTAALTVWQTFWDSTANPDVAGGAGAPKTQGQLRDLATFASAGWKIQAGSPATGDNLWGICSPTDTSVHNGYPFLLWEHPSGDPCHPVPTAPVLDSLTTGDRSIAVVATLGADGGKPVTSVQYQLDDGPWTDSGGATGTFPVNGLTNGTTYRVRVRAVNAIGPSSASNELAATPDAQTVLTVNARNKHRKLTVGARNVLVRSVRSNGTILSARVICTLHGTHLPPRLRDRFCAPAISGAAATGGTAAAKVKRKNLRITSAPTCSAGLKVRVKITAKAKHAARATYSRTYRVHKHNPCRVRATG